MSSDGRRAVAGGRIWGLLLWIVWGLLAGPAWSAGSCPPSAPRYTVACGQCSIRPQDSFWIVSSRHLGCPDPHHADIAQFRYRRYDPQHGCQSADAGQLLLDQREQTVIYVHGNRIEPEEVFQRAMLAYRALTCGADDPRSIRFIAWSWPSDQMCGPRRDAQIKAARSDIESFYLGVLISQLPPDTRLGMFGYSLGSRAISGALHLMGGGQRCGYGLPDLGPGLAEGPRIALMAPALDRCWWLSGGPHERCPAVAGAILVMYNPCDPVLKLYPRLDRARPQAMGYAGFPWANRLGADGNKIQLMNVCCQVGRTHDERLYFASPAIMNQVRRCVLGLDDHST